MKKYLLPGLIVTILLQLLVPSYKIYVKYDILRTGDVYYFRVNPVDPYDAFRGRYVYLYAPLDVGRYGKYGLITVDADGFARVTELSDEKPAAGPYVKSERDGWFAMPISVYYMDEHLAPRAETYVRQRNVEEETYVSVRIKEGELVVSGLFVNGVPIEEIVKDGFS
ncbi:MAG: GDYXXLXY domain-containing protein [Clostridiales bacterium]|nr:GDYXXLXY domain-containing protein [Clostridiales bacterium]